MGTKMVKRFYFFLLVLAGIALAATIPARADDTPELLVQSGASTTGILVGTGGTVSYSNSNFAGWDITITLGQSNSPGTSPYGLDLLSLNAGCVSGSCSALDLQLSDVGFAYPTDGLISGFSATDTGAGASAEQLAWYSTTNTDFAMTNSLGAVGPFVGAGTFSGSSFGAGPGSTTPYSLTIEDILAGCNGSNCASYSIDGNIVATPEPSTVAMLALGLGLIGLISLSLGGWRRRALLQA